MLKVRVAALIAGRRRRSGAKPSTASFMPTPGLLGSGNSRLVDWLYDQNVDNGVVLPGGPDHPVRPHAGDLESALRKAASRPDWKLLAFGHDSYRFVTVHDPATNETFDVEINETSR